MLWEGSTAGWKHAIQSTAHLQEDIAPCCPPAPSSGLRHQTHSYQGGCAGLPAYDPIPGYEPSLSEVTEAHKLSKYAASALSFEDIPTAIKHLTDALKLLTQPNQLKPHHPQRR